MLKTVLSIGAALSMLLSGGYTPSMTEIDRVPGDIAALRQTAAGLADENEIFSIEHFLETDVVTNHLDGYRLTVPSGLKPDASLSNVRLKLAGSGYSIEIFKESFSEQSDCSTYISYSNRFLDDTKTYAVKTNHNDVINGKNAHVLVWSRPTLGYGDVNHYANIDIVDGTDVYTITIKSSAEIDDWRQIAESFTILPASEVKAVARSFPSAGENAMNAETKTAFNEIFGETSPLSWGLMVPRQPKEGMTAFEDVEKSLGGKMKICLFYEFITYDEKCDVYSALTNAWESGKISELTMQISPGAAPSMIYDILKGKCDAYINLLINDVKTFAHPVLMRLFNEMNGEWCNYSGYHTSRDPDVYVKLYRYIVDKFRAAGVDNVIWIWNPNEKSYPNFRWNNEELYYPGSEYVDVVGLTGYNTGTYYEGEKWRSFDRIYENIYTKAELMYNKPMMITEFSCSTTGGDKEAWVRDMFRSLPNYPKIKAAVWWSGSDLDPANGNVSRSYYINDTPGVMAAFKENLTK